MAAAKSRPAKGKPSKKGFRGRMPTKRSINLILIDENKINPLKAIPAVLLIIVLAAAFSKYLVIDRMQAVSVAAGKVSTLRTQLDSTLDQIETIGEVEDTYAHYTIDGMTSTELEQVDRVQVLELVYQVIIANATLSTEEFCSRLTEAADVMRAIQGDSPGLGSIGAYIRQSVSELMALRRANTTEATTWNLTGNVLTVNVTGRSLNTMNEVAQMLEASPIVDSCVLTTANKSDRTDLENRVSGRFIVYLQQAPEEEEVEAS